MTQINRQIGTRSARAKYPSLRGWGCCAARALLAAVLISIVSVADAGWLHNREQAAQESFEAGDYGAAAEGFRDHYRAGVALYRAGEYEASAKEFEQVQREAVAVDAMYNLGNARFMQEQYERAEEAYEEVLSRRPEDENARANLILVQAMLGKLDEEMVFKEEEPEKEQQEKQEQEKQEKQEQEKQEQEKQEKQE
ncbi:MAG: tetratricopeptide repeat protein, partial [Pseudomonadota bacterium]|nr:tetratricopeptide repeat protein [Pseudomonadota bacterium]